MVKESDHDSMDNNPGGVSKAEVGGSGAPLGIHSLVYSADFCCLYSLCPLLDTEDSNRTKDAKLSSRSLQFSHSQIHVPNAKRILPTRV